MAEEKTLKPVSYRIDDETKEKFKEITASIGGNQQDTMAALINAYYMQQKEIGLSDYKADIDRFQAYITSLVTMYTNSLQTNHDMRDTIMSQFEETLKSKDSIIVDLQKKLAAEKRNTENSEVLEKELLSENQKLSDKIDQIKKSLADKDNLNKALTESCDDLKTKVKDMAAAAQKTADLEKEVADLKAELQRADLEKEKAMLELKAEKQSEVDQYQKKYMELFEKLKNK